MPHVFSSPFFAPHNTPKLHTYLPSCTEPFPFLYFLNNPCISRNTIITPTLPPEADKFSQPLSFYQCGIRNPPNPTTLVHSIQCFGLDLPYREPVTFFISCVLISQLIRYARACSSYECFILRAARLSSKLLGQGYVMERLKSSLRNLYGRYGDLIKHYSVSLSQMLDDILGHDHIQ